ncbi:winged helix-turn-helix domain-containing protein [Pseudonocardia parietis]|jgi:GntR family transcriptional repressor for pyruvate dehydrogenase complex|uniref:DNA-binding FadR family transcriptional regulator n=1 Tax=Pseudonocardia parietis TaxID=570936 RepID=A0ABS4VL83_9PSEU|nr:winged helix-turn-helix domain-containing protein [Pseudonocardia parietis]MBP2364556.1 DNA-binding FadR family transcriptional regulator [Pseudonocardia parietis]
MGESGEQRRALTELLAIVGTSKAGDRLPAERRLAEQLGVSRSAVRHALRELSRHELIATRRQAGSFVTAPGPAAVPGAVTSRA